MTEIIISKNLNVTETSAVKGNSDHCYTINGLTFPKPICRRCNKVVDKLDVREGFIFNTVPVYIFEVTCHGGYEMYKIDRSVFATPNIEVVQGTAF